MGARGTKSAAQKVVQLRRLEEMGLPAAPKEFAKAERDEWNDIVSSKPPDFFTRATWPMLENYCTHQVEARRIKADIRELVKDPEHSRREYRELLRSLTDQSKAVASFGVRLGIARTSMAGRHNHDPDTVAEDIPWET